MTADLAITARERETILSILNAHLPESTRVDAFGSRVTGAAKSWSDLDLAIAAPHVLSLSAMAELAEAFAESDLPWKVDLVDRHAISEEFTRIIDAAKVRLR